MHHARIDKLAAGDSVIHRLDARGKLAVVIAFSVYVLSIRSESISFLPCCAIGPFALLVFGKVPLKFVFKQILIVSPFIIFVAASSIFYTKETVVVSFGPAQIVTTVGTVRCAGILIKFVITMAALLGLIGTTRFGELLDAMGRCGVPKILTMQISFVYRFIFLMIDRGHHILMARNARRIGRMGLKRELATAAAMGGSLFLGSIDTAGKVNMSMLARGFDGTFHGNENTTFKRIDAVFFSITVVYIGFLIILSKAL